MKCKRCGRENPSNVRRCLYCNTPFYGNYSNINMPQNRKRKKKKDLKNQKTDNAIIAVIIALVLVFTALTGVYAFQNYVPHKKGFTGGSGGGVGGVVAVSSTAGNNNNGAFSLEASKHELEVGSSDNVVYFYAKPKGTVTVVELTDDEGNIIAEMKDDGLYSESGDDLQNDGVYTAKIQIDTTQEKTYHYSAIANSNKSNKSNSVKVNAIALLTDTEINNIRKVDEALEKLRNSDTYKGYSIDERRNAILDKLNAFVQEGIILENSIYDDKENNIITFCYSSGVLAVEELEDFSKAENGFTNLREKYKINQFAGSSNNTPNINDIDVGRAKIMYATDNTKSERYDIIQSLQEDWNSKGLKTEIDTDVTVSDMKGLKGYNFICVDAHGAYYTFSYEYDKEYTWYFKKISSKTTTVTAPGVMLREKTSSKKDKEYSLGLKSGKVLHHNGHYGIVPEFFTQYYNSKDLEGSIFLWSCCEFMGKDNSVQEAWTQAMKSRNVAAFIGYHNSVYGMYVYHMLYTIVPNLINGDTIKEAYEKAIDENGADDVIWFNNQDWKTEWYEEILKMLDLYKEPTAHSPAAYPLLRGDSDATLVNLSLKNGNFEEDSTTIKNWKKTGDVRLLTKLGEVMPREGSQMAILTTGIGSGQSTYLNSTEGSSLYQTVKLGNKLKFSFDYNIISEEPTEYIGSQYDDKFYAEILNSKGEVIKTVASETVNNSTWYPVADINFEGGDDTVYQTGWKNIECDLSDLKGQIVTIRFSVFDVGDSEYDTAAVIDNVALK